MNFGVTGVAAPKAASSSTSRYSWTARLAASGDKPSAPGTPFCRLASALVRLPSTAKPSPPTRPSATQRPRTVQAPKQIALPEAPVPVLRESGVIGHPTVQPEPTEPAVGEVEVHFFAKPPLGADAEAVTDDQHPDHQLRVDR